MELPGDLYTTIEELSESGNHFIENDEYDSAIKVLSEAIELLPQPALQWDAATWLYGSLGDAQYSLHRFPDAVESFQIALTSPGGKENPFLHLRKGQCLLSLGDTQQAAHHLTIAYMFEGEGIFSDEPEEVWAFISTELKISNEESLDG